MSYVSGAYTVSFLLVIFGLLFFLAGHNTGNKDKKMGIHTLFYLLGFCYLILAHFSLMSGVAYQTEYANNATCENILNHTVEAPANTIAYYHVDSCASRGRYELADNILVIYIWFGGGLTMLFMFSLVWMFGRMVKMW